MGIKATEHNIWMGRPALEIGIKKIIFLNFFSCLLLYGPMIILNLIQITLQTILNYSYCIYIYEFIIILTIFLYFTKEDAAFTRITFSITNEHVIIESSSRDMSKTSLSVNQIKHIKIKKGFWDSKRINSGSLMISGGENGKKNIKLRYINDVNKVAKILGQLVPNIEIKLDNSEFQNNNEISIEKLFSNTKILWIGKKSLIYMHEILSLTGELYWLIFVFPIAFSFFWNTLNELELFTVLLIIFAFSYAILCVFNALYVESANKMHYAITDEKIIRLNNIRFKEIVPLIDIKAFHIKLTILKCKKFDIGTVNFYKRTQKRPKIAFHSIENLNDVAELLTKLNLSSMDNTNWVLNDMHV